MATSTTLKDASTVSTLVDAALTLARGRHESGIVLVGAALASRRVPGLGTATSLLIRLIRRFR
jgi:hypothetical protein